MVKVLGRWHLNLSQAPTIEGPTSINESGQIQFQVCMVLGRLPGVVTAEQVAGWDDDFWEFFLGFSH